MLQVGTALPSTHLPLAPHTHTSAHTHPKLLRQCNFLRSPLKKPLRDLNQRSPQIRNWNSSACFLMISPDSAATPVSDCSLLVTLVYSSLGLVHKGFFFFFSNKETGMELSLHVPCASLSWCAGNVLNRQCAFP